MNTELTEIKKRIASLLPKLPDEIDRSWLASTYLSLRKAHALCYQNDSISRLPKNGQDRIVLEITSLDARRAPKEIKDWIAAYYFNNALFRTVALTEIGLKVLFEKKMKMEPPPKSYQWLADWYKTDSGMTLNNIANARKRVNKFKHEPRRRINKKKFETMREGIDALKELLLLLEKI